eukprot:2984872-Heterocapsa_arctica.AAC.1
MLAHPDTTVDGRHVVRSQPAFTSPKTNKQDIIKGLGSRYLLFPAGRGRRPQGGRYPHGEEQGRGPPAQMCAGGGIHRTKTNNIE